MTQCTSHNNISSTQAIFLGAIIVFLLVVAFVIFLVSWVATKMLSMQQQHEDKILELHRQHSLQSRVSDLEAGRDPVLLKGRGAKK